MHETQVYFQVYPLELISGVLIFNFVDDILIFLEGSLVDLRKNREILDVFCLASDMKINNGKYSMFFYGLIVQERSDIGD